MLETQSLEQTLETQRLVHTPTEEGEGGGGDLAHPSVRTQPPR